MSLKQTSDEKIFQIRELLFDEIFVSKAKGKNHVAIRRLFIDLFELVSGSYEDHVQITNRLFIILESFHELAVDHLFSMLSNNVSILKDVQISQDVEPSWKSKISEEFLEANIKEEFIKVKNDIVKTGQSLDKISNKLKFSGLPPKYQHIAFIFYNIQSCLNTMDCVKNNIQTISEDLCVFRNVISPGEFEEFYLLISDVVQSLDQGQLYHISLNCVMDCLNASYKDKCTYMGYYLMAGHLIRSHKTLKALFYLNLLIYTINTKQTISKSLLFSVYWESIVFCRDNRYENLGKQLFHDVPIETGSFTLKRRFYCTYFYMLANIYEKDLPQLIFTFFEQFKTDFIHESEAMALPWYVLLLRIKKEETEFNISDPNKLEEYLTLFGDILPKEMREKHYTTFFGTLLDMKTKLIAAFQELSFTDNRLDFINENKYSLSLANVLMKKSRDELDVGGFLLAMIVKSDLSVVFNNKEQFLKAHSSNVPFLAQQIDLIKSLANVNVLWLGSDGVHVYPLRLRSNEFLWNENKRWTLAASNSFFEQVVKYLSFDPGLYSSSPGIYISRNKELISNLYFSIFPSFFDTQILVIKDILLSNFPHNLILDNEGFLIDRYPITNIISIEWLVENLKNKITDSFTISLWIPLGAILFDEFTEINSKLEETVVKHRILLENKILPQVPMGSTVNIVVAHGSNEITSFPAFYFKEEGIFTVNSDLDSIIGTGKVLILFVCHGGLSKTDSYRGQVASLATQYLRNGYAAVIAPFWSLSTAIPPIWLSAFIDSLKEGVEISQAVWLANKSVRDEFDSPNAYASMHLYGNPFFRCDTLS